MKNMAGIDLSDLTEAQRKMCVKLLAANNVEFIQTQNNYVATLRVPTKQINNYLNEKKNQPKDLQHKNMKKNQKNKQNAIEKITMQKVLLRQRSVGKSKQKQKGKVAIKQAINKKEGIKAMSGRKSLFKTIKLPCISKLQMLYPQIQVYIYPKRLTLCYLQQQIQQIYENFWQLSKQCNGLEIFHKCFIQNICTSNSSTSKSRNDQNLVNVLESINHYQHKQMGIRIFYLFLSEEYTKEMLAYFLVIRALIQELLGQKIIAGKARAKALTQNTFANSSSSNTNIMAISGVKQKLKWNPHQKQISEFMCQNFLKIVIPNHNNIDAVFEQLTQFMYYCEAKKGNFILYYQLIDFMLKRFNEECQDITVTNLQLSYSNNDSTLNDIVAQSANKSSDRPLQTNFQLSLIPESELNLQSQLRQKQDFNNDEILIQKSIQNAKQICRRFEISPQKQDEILKKVVECIESVKNMDKIKWVQSMEIQGNQQQLNFIQQIQIHYKDICEDGLKIPMINSLVKKIFVGPGFIKLFSKHISF